MVKNKKLEKDPKNNCNVNDDIDYYKKLADENLKELRDSEDDLITPNEKSFVSKVKEKYSNND